jgi:type IV pilus assembly protein PilN
MIRINLIGVERQTKKAVSFDLGQQVPALCALIVLLAAGGTGWWYWSLGQESRRLDAEITAANREVARLKSAMAEVEKFEARSALLQERVKLIEQLRTGQGVPVQLLDHISRSVPDSLWLTVMQQDGATVTIEGRSTTLIALSDFVGNLGSSAVLQKPIEIVSSQVEPGDAGRSAASKGGPALPDLISFVVRAQVVGAQISEPPASGKKKGRA